jgi:hypothetical protein
MIIKYIRYGRVVPHPVIKFSTIKIELEAEVENDETPEEVYKRLKNQVNVLVKQEAS